MTRVLLVCSEEANGAVTSFWRKSFPKVRESSAPLEVGMEIPAAMITINYGRLEKGVVYRVTRETSIQGELVEEDRLKVENPPEVLRDCLKPDEGWEEIRLPTG